MRGYGHEGMNGAHEGAFLERGDGGRGGGDTALGVAVGEISCGRCCAKAVSALVPRSATAVQKGGGDDDGGAEVEGRPGG